MNQHQLEHRLTELVSRYDDPEGLFQHSVEEFMYMYQLRGNRNELVQYLLESGYVMNKADALEFAQDIYTAEGVVNVLSEHLSLIANLGKIQLKR